MQPNPQERTNKKRLLTDAIFKQVVTFFGWLVLAMFLLIILHMLSNAWPLLKTPTLTFSHSLALNTFSPIVSLQQMGDDIVTISTDNCKVNLHAVNRSRMDRVAQFHHACSSGFIPVEGEQGYVATYGILKEDGLVELYSVNNLSNNIQRTLVGSFNVPDYLQVKRRYGADVGKWKIHKYQHQVVLYNALENDSVIALWHELNQLRAPTVQILTNAASFTPLSRFEQAIIVRNNQALLINKQLQAIQSLSQNARSDVPVLMSVNQRAAYVPSQDAAMQVWRSSNVGGDFLFSAAGNIVDLHNSVLRQIVFDRQTLVAIATDGEGHLLTLNSATNEVVNKQSTEFDVQAIFWHGQQLFVFTVDKVHLYDLQNAPGVTTWKSLFSKVHYSGYSEAHYIWQTSQSAEYAQRKFSLVPLIIGSLKASFLALFVAIPLALGAAIYTAYFASSSLRSWVKPSIEMIEAIPSVIIGFIAAVWLAPFAERSLFALLGMLICLPVVVLGVAALHGLLKQSNFYHVWHKFYLLAASCIFLLFLGGIFQIMVLAQVVIASSEHTLVGAFLSNVIISKTTVVVALALGIAVAPTIYSLVDDALFEVPEGVKHASFALGATELQTLSKVVLVVALPSIISAIMLGLGRAFGETMIVLMVTGNTPIADWDLLSGLRSLTSNLAIEMQEASVGSAHYHILFLTAVILFAFTFAINTIAALLKRRLQGAKQNV
jgi:phosphate transport system permease protein